MELTAEQLQEIMEAALHAVIAPPGQEAPAPPPEPERIHQNPRQFFDGYLSVVFARDLGRDDVHWCEKWFEHPEAAEVIESLWQCWETLWRDENTGHAVWFVNFAYPLMTRLFDPSGTFSSCSEGACNAPPPLPPHEG